MSVAAEANATIDSDLLAMCRTALAAANAHLAAAQQACTGRVAPDGQIDRSALDAHQFAAHGFAWTATYVTALHQLNAWAERLAAEDSAHALIRFDDQLTLELNVTWAGNFPTGKLPPSLMGFFGDQGGMTFELFGDHINVANKQFRRNVDPRATHAHQEEARS